eukprot:2794111-Pleurochrysis_carterae.AAC.1
MQQYSAVASAINFSHWYYFASRHIGAANKSVRKCAAAASFKLMRTSSYSTTPPPSAYLHAEMPSVHESFHRNWHRANLQLLPALYPSPATSPPQSSAKL